VTGRGREEGKVPGEVNRWEDSRDRTWDRRYLVTETGQEGRLHATKAQEIQIYYCVAGGYEFG